MTATLTPASSRIIGKLWVVLAFLLLVSCQTGGGSGDIEEDSAGTPLDKKIFEDPTLTPESPRLRLLLVDKPVSGIENVWLTVSSITAQPESGAWVTLSSEVQTFDLLDLRYGLARTLSLATIPAGNYSQIRLLVTDASVVVEGETHDLKVPSGNSSGLKIQFNFTVTNQQVATMLIDWDASESIHYAPGEGYIMQPVIKVRSFRTEELDSTLPGAPSVDSPSHPTPGAWYGTNTLEMHWSATDNVGVDRFSFLLDHVADTVPDEVADETAEEAAPERCQQAEYPSAPTCAEFEPSVTLANGLVTIYGTNFGRTKSTVSATIGGQNAEVMYVGPTEMTIKAPPGTGYKAVIITTPKGSVQCQREVSIVQDTAFCPDGAYELGKGLLGKVYPVAVNLAALPDFSTFGEPHSTIIACKLDVPDHDFNEGFPGVDSTLLEWFAIRFTSKLIVPSTGTYSFQTTSDDGSKLYIDNVLVVNNDGVHAKQTKNGSIDLAAGEHDLVQEYYQGPRYRIAMQLFWKKPGDSAYSIIPKASFKLPPSLQAQSASLDLCTCDGSGGGVYNYQVWGVDDGTGKLWTIDLYNDNPTKIEIGTVKSGNSTLSDLESLAWVGGQLYAVNNSGGGSSTKSRLFRIKPELVSSSVVPVDLMGQLKEGNSQVNNLSCLAASPDGQLYGVSKDTQKLYKVDPNSAKLTFVMFVSGQIDACAFGPSGSLYGIDNAAVKPALVELDMAGQQITKIADLTSYSTDIYSLGWHPDGYLYAGIINSSNSYPAIAKIRPSDGVVATELLPTLKLSAVKGLDFNFDTEDSSCGCDLALAEDANLTISGNLSITDGNSDAFAETISFTGNQVVLSALPTGDALNSYVGVNTACNLPKSRVLLTGLTLNKAAVKANRFPLVSSTYAGGFLLKVLKTDCTYQTLVSADVSTSGSYLFATGNHGSFRIAIDNATVTNTINSGVLEALDEQDGPAGLTFSFTISNPSLQNNIKNGTSTTGAHTGAMVPGYNTAVSEEPNLPECPDPTAHLSPREASTLYAGLEDGIYFFHVRAVDDSGNWGPASHFEVRIDATAPGAPEITSPTHVSPEIGYRNDTPEFLWTLTDLSGITHYSFTFDDKAGTSVDESPDGTLGSAEFPNQTTGSYWMHVRGRNAAGLWGPTAHFKVMVTGNEQTVPQPPPGYQRKPRLTFVMGCPASKPDCEADEKPHWVEVPGFAIMEHEVTNEEYRACRDLYTETDTDCESDADCEGAATCGSKGVCVTGCEFDPRDDAATYWKSGLRDHPVAHVTWRDAETYCRTIGARLPTEAEWEYAARHEDTDRYPWGDGYEANRANGYDLGLDATTEVGAFDGETNGRGDGRVCVGEDCLSDMSGNVWEWVSDNYLEYFPEAPTQDDAVSDPNYTEDTCVKACGADSSCRYKCQTKTVRGGSFRTPQSNLRVFKRLSYPESYAYDDVGFRCAIDWNYEEEETTDPEICDGVDNDLDGRVDEGYPDTDADGRANCIDDDDDDDGVTDAADNCPLDANTDQYDPDLDGFGDLCDPNGESLPVSYAGLIRPWDVTVDPDGTFFVAGSLAGVELTTYDNNEKGTLLSLSATGLPTGQVVLANVTASATQYEDYRPNKISLSPIGHLYVTDAFGAYDNGVFKVVRDEATGQLGSGESPEDRNGETGRTQRFWMGDSTQRGIGNTSGSVLDGEGSHLYITRGNASEVRRYALDAEGNLLDPAGDSDLIASFSGYIHSPAVSPIDGHLYYCRDGRLYRQKIVDDAMQTPEQLSDKNAFRNTVALEFDADGNLYVLHNRGTSNVWPFIGSQADKDVPAESGYISRVSYAVLEQTTVSNIITHGDETKQTLVYGGPNSREILFADPNAPTQGQRLNNPMGFDVDETTGRLVIANTDSDELVVLDPADETVILVVNLNDSFQGVP